MLTSLVARIAASAARTRPALPAVSAFLALLGGLSALARPCAAAELTQAWIVRSEVASGHSMVSPARGVGSVYASDSYRFETWPFRGGFDWTVNLDPGTLTGNIEGALQATYQSTLAQPGHTTLKLRYGGIPGESRITGSVKANISIRPSVGVNILGFWTDLALPITALNWNLTTNADFTTGLNAVRATDSVRQTLVEVGGDLLALHYGVDVHANCSFSFEPRLLSGTLVAEHVDTRQRRTSTVDFWADGTRELDLNLDLPGQWRIKLQDFYMEQSDFRMQFSFGTQFAMGIPLTGTSMGFGGDITVFDSGTFRPRFDKHWVYDETVGEFCVYVVPEPSTLAILGGGLALSCRRWRRR